MERSQLSTIGIIISIIGALLFFSTWIYIDYYDYYGPLYYDLNGFSVLLSADEYGILTSAIPLIIAIMFIVMVSKFSKNSYDLVKTATICCILTFVLVTMFNVFVTRHYWDDYYDEFHYSNSFPGNWSFILSIVNLVLASVIERKNRAVPVNYYPPAGISQPVNYFRYCRKCGSGLTEEQYSNSKFCVHCGEPLNKEEPKPDDEQIPDGK